MLHTPLLESAQRQASHHVASTCLYILSKCMRTCAHLHNIGACTHTYTCAYTVVGCSCVRMCAHVRMHARSCVCTCVRWPRNHSPLNPLPPCALGSADAVMYRPQMRCYIWQRISSLSCDHDKRMLGNLPPKHWDSCCRACKSLLLAHCCHVGHRLPQQQCLAATRATALFFLASMN